MGRAVFGSSSDYSSLFASLYENLGAAEGGSAGSTAAEAANLRYQYEAGLLDAAGYAAALRALAATGDQTTTNHFNLLTTAVNAEQAAAEKANATAKQAAADAQAAADQTAADQWASGDLSDQDWLAYVAGRASSATDPQDKAQWNGYLLRYTDQINDNTAEGTYEAGGSINDLILYYQRKLATATTHNTQEYRDAQIRLNSLQDQRSATTVQDGASAISVKIDRGTATHQDLLKFYQQQLSGVRPRSDLYKQLQAEIAKVQTTILTTVQAGALEKLQYDYERGAITGATFAKGIRAAAAQFQKTDPQKYYQMLESAVQLDKDPGFIGAAARARAAANAAKAAKTKALAATVDQLQGQRDNLLALVNQADAGQKTGYDAITGKTVTFTSKLVDSLDHQILDTYKALSAAHEAKGDRSAAQADMANMSDYIIRGAGGNTVGIIGHNTAKVEDTYTSLVLATVKELQGNAVSLNPDPRVVSSVAGKWAKFATSLEHTTKNVTKQTIGGNDIRVAVQGPERTQLQSIDPTFVAQVGVITKALQTTAARGSTPEQQQAAVDSLAIVFGADPAFPDASPGSKAFQNISRNLIDPAFQISGSAAGLADGTVARAVSPSGQIGYFPLATQSPTEIADGLSPQPILATGWPLPNGRSESYDPANGQKLVKIVVDINGHPTAIDAVATPASTSQMTWVAAQPALTGTRLAFKAGDILTNDQVDALDKSFPRWRQNGTASLVPYANYYSVTTPVWTDTKGQTHASETWVQDAQTGQWYKDKLPIRGVQYRDDGTVQVIKGADGPQALMDFKSFADASGVPAPYVGNHPEKVGALIGAPNGISVAGIMGRDINGFLIDKPSNNLAYAYFDPVTDFLKNPANRDNWWQDEQRAQRANEAKAKSLLQTARTPTQMKPTVASPGKLMDDVVNFGSSIGLNMSSGRGGVGSWAPKQVNEQTDFTVPVMPARQPALTAPRTLQLPTVAAPTYSGPVLAQNRLDLPTVKASTVAVPVIKMPTTTAAQVTAAATAAAQKALTKLPTVVLPTQRERGATEF